MRTDSCCRTTEDIPSHLDKRSRRKADALTHTGSEVRTGDIWLREKLSLRETRSLCLHPCLKLSRVLVVAKLVLRLRVRLDDPTRMFDNFRRILCGFWY